MNMSKIIKSIDMDIDDCIYRMAVNFINSDELYLEYDYNIKEITSSEIWIDRVNTKYKLSDDEIDKYMKYFDLFNNILYDTIPYNITRITMVFLDSLNDEDSAYQDILYECWYSHHSDKDNIPGVFERPIGYVDVYSRIIHERGITVCNYSDINESNSIIISDTRDVIMAIKNIYRNRGL